MEVYVGTMPENKIPQVTAKRLPLYYRYLEKLHAIGKQRVSSADLSDALHIDPATIRRDFSYLGELGKKVTVIMLLICFNFYGIS